MNKVIGIILLLISGGLFYTIGKSKGWFTKKNTAGSTSVTSNTSTDNSGSSSNSDSNESTSNSLKTIQTKVKSTTNGFGVDTSIVLGTWYEKGGEPIYAKRYGKYASGTYAVGFLYDGTQVYSYYRNEGTENEEMTYSLSPDGLVL